MIDELLRPERAEPGVALAVVPCQRRLLRLQPGAGRLGDEPLQERQQLAVPLRGAEVLVPDSRLLVESAVLGRERQGH